MVKKQRKRRLLLSVAWRKARNNKLSGKAGESERDWLPHVKVSQEG